MPKEWKRSPTLRVPPLCSEAFELWISGKSFATIAYSSQMKIWNGQFTHANTGRAMAFFCETREEARILCEAVQETGQCMSAPWSQQ